ncbi:MAG: restriction endonuclease subunit S [Chloroflexi bacterium]|nr:restriction endonuclease subunit S [Chloroflexota bacterium]MCI0646892.1 restriction endonuclease subunit S [Chloroflexota bacterium]MCI0729103.1 restriction endonuclease subunit S [Chloroflexota bacterium]
MMKSGYKQSEVGPIPEDWGIEKISNLASITTGSRNTQDRKPDGEFPFFVRSQLVERIDTYSYDGEAVLTAGDGVGTGKVFHYINGKFDYHQRVYKISDFKPVLNGFYFYNYFSNRFYDRIMAMTAKSSVDSVRMEMIANMWIPLPPLQEQWAIADALRGVDGLLVALDRLIAKKRDMKTAVMQQLLTGERRLPGFNGRWVEKSLGEVCSYINDGTHYTPKYVDDGVPFYSVETITENNFSNTKYISRNAHELLIKRCKPERGDILMTRIGTLGQTKLIDWDVNASIYVSLALLKLKDRVHIEYIYRYTKSERFVQDVEQRSLLHATPKKINVGQIGDIPIYMPVEEEEQIAIAQILSDMDAEIAALEARRAKTQAIKQGMMQELLTGKTRLVPHRPPP